ncbi:MAG: phage tail sheath family protein [Sphingobacteriaceae bacterium]
MIQQRFTPGVYIKELNAFPNSIVEVATALPVFIGYTQQASFQGASLQNKVVKINSLSDYTTFFGSGPNTMFNVTKATPSSANPNPPVDITLNNVGYTVTPQSGGMFYMYNSVQLFFQNGGGTCYIMSIGTYANEGANGPNISNFQTLSGGKGDIFSVLKSEPDPTMILIPDALLFSKQIDYYTLMNDCLDHCAEVQSRMTFIDAYQGNLITNPLAFAAANANQDVNGNTMDPIGQLRGGVTSQFLNYGAAYYPWVNSSVVGSNQFNFTNIVGGFASSLFDTNPIVAATVAAGVPKILASILTATSPSVASLPTDAQKNARIQASQLTAHNALLAISPNYSQLIQTMLAKVNCLPVTPAVAGCICSVDSSQGVWKAPANIALNAVQSAVINIDDSLQDNMNVDSITGKSVNVIRPFSGLGVMIWGARTLDGNSQDWRYLSVRRTLIMIEQSVKRAARTYVFQANDANTWQNLQSEIENFLTGLWKQGALAGAKAEEAFSVSVGLGSTMVATDILDGYLDVAILLAVTHPAEFIEISFKQQLQTS